MKRLSVLGLLAGALGGCSNANWHGEAWRQYYPRPAAETERHLQERRIIQHWTGDPRNKETVGILEKYTVLFEGSRIPRDYYVILNAAGTRPLGHVNEEGVFYRFTEDGGMEKVGEYVIIDTGVKIFFGYPLSDHLGFEPVDPYTD